MSFTWNPVTGLNDTTQFPDSDPLIRSHMQNLLQQLPDYFDSQLAAITNIASLSNSGWFKDKKTGLIIQWGRVSVAVTANVNAQTSITFPITFPTNCLSISYAIRSLSTTTGKTHVWGNNDPTLTGNTNVGVWCEATNTVVINYIAIGF